MILLSGRSCLFALRLEQLGSKPVQELARLFQLWSSIRACLSPRQRDEGRNRSELLFLLLKKGSDQALN